MDDTAEQFVNRMLGRKHDWMGILSVARCARGVKWRKDAERILKELGKMPTDEKVIHKAYEDEASRRAKAESIILSQKPRKHKS
jgi:hypothetical protein